MKQLVSNRSPEDKFLDTNRVAHPISHTRSLGTGIGKPRRTIHNLGVESLGEVSFYVPGGRVRNLRPLLGCICGNRHSFASSASSGFGLGIVRQSQLCPSSVTISWGTIETVSGHPCTVEV